MKLIQHYKIAGGFLGLVGDLDRGTQHEPFDAATDNREIMKRLFKKTIQISRNLIADQY